MDNPFFVTAGILAVMFTLPLLLNWVVNRSRTPDKWVPILPWASWACKVAAVVTLAYMMYEAVGLILGAIDQMTEQPSNVTVFCMVLGIAAMWSWVGLAAVLVISNRPKAKAVGQ